MWPPMQPWGAPPAVQVPAQPQVRPQPPPDAWAEYLARQSATQPTQQGTQPAQDTQSAAQTGVATGTLPPPSPEPTFKGQGSADASKAITGVLADNLLKQTEANIASRLAIRNLPANAWRQVAGDLGSKDGPRQCPSWDGKEPGKTIRPWLKSQLFWQIRTPTQPQEWVGQCST